MLFLSVLKRKSTLDLIIVFPVLVFMSCCNVQGKCRPGCDLALASYYVAGDVHNVTYISSLFELANYRVIGPYNPQFNLDSIKAGDKIRVPFSCDDCVNGDVLGHTFSYTTMVGDTYDKVAQNVYANLTTSDWLQRVNSYAADKIPDSMPINVTVNCSCGDGRVSKDYGLFMTYPLRSGDNLTSVAAEAEVSAEILQRYNPEVDFSAGSGLVFIPAKVSNKNKSITQQSAGQDAKCQNPTNPLSYLPFQNPNYPTLSSPQTMLFISVLTRKTTVNFIMHPRNSSLNNPQIKNQDYIVTGDRIHVPFPCDCLNGDSLVHTFSYITQFEDKYDKVAQTVYANLSTWEWVHRVHRVNMAALSFWPSWSPELKGDHPATVAIDTYMVVQRLPIWIVSDMNVLL
ncbi:hypothetical protein SLEP1_g47960 [Rubroshorea leprosula]|uniref:Uncharacterized protein n=1 Tax=Rubroshorea leprosula TaxID=152421 RepID=A0AAV5LS63_9ROSI|nr:hypothetical protein SLEP1_g47960 [Rubroshorea leprosula]